MSIISSDITLSQSIINGYSWPVTINASVTVTIGEDLSISTSTGGTDGYFIIWGDNVTIDGNGKTVTINNISSYPGLVQNGTNVSNGKSTILIKDLGVLSTGSSLAVAGGWIGQEYFGKNASDSNINNCYSSGAIGIAAGGIFGAASSGTATNCYSSGVISDDSAGGIFGAESSGTATNCYSLGEISGNGAGGIYGWNSSGTATNCYSSGAISGSSAGGIFGADSSGTANYCYIANNTWSDSAATSNLTNIDTVWLDYDTVATNVPWVLRSFLIAYDQSVTTNEDESVQITLASYATEDPFTGSIVTQPQNGTLSSVNSFGQVTYTPDTNYFGQFDTFTFKLSADNFDSNTATVQITVTPVNDKPIAYDQSVTTNEDTSVTFTLAAYDQEGDTLIYSIVTQPQNGTLSGLDASTGQVTYISNTAFTGTDTFTFKVNDGNLDSNPATVTINISSIRILSVKAIGGTFQRR